MGTDFQEARALPRDETHKGPEHVAIIMDGNGRWATRRGLPRLAGHKQGAETVRKIVRACPDLGIRHLTLFAFSTENWKRSTEEVDGLMQLFRHYIAREAEKLIRENVRVRFIGSRERLAPDIIRKMEDLEERTEHMHDFSLNVALNHGGRDEIARATRRVARKVAAGEIAPENICEDLIEAHLDTAGVPDPCLVIRTSGEYRISNFLLWQAAYSEYEFVETCWPDFSPDELQSIVARFGQRERRFGAVAG